MSSERSNPSSFQATYYRDYGLHKTDLWDKPTYIASAPTWEDMEQLLKFQLPYSGDVVTNDYATTSVDIDKAPVNLEEAEERIRAVRYMSLRSDATIHLGTPHRGKDGKAYLAALTINRGEVLGKTYKKLLYDVEKEGGLTNAPMDDDSVREDGTAPAICSDLIGIESFYSPNEKRLAKRLFALTAWAYTDTDYFDNTAAIEAAGGEDNFRRERLELVIGKCVLPHLPNVRSVVVSDEGRPDLAPYNAVFTRKS